MAGTLRDRLRTALATAEPHAKAGAVHALARDWQEDHLDGLGDIGAPDRPGRPDAPRLVAARDLPKRGPVGSPTHLHALAHIEFNAIDLALDIAARFEPPEEPSAFLGQWLAVAADEARHFLALEGRLREMGSHYGAWTAHDGLWQAAEETSDDLLARLAIVPLVLEARGLDVTPPMIAALPEADPTRAVLQMIHDDEIGHVAVGARWFRAEAARRGVEPKQAWQEAVQTRFRGRLKRPFNEEAREIAGFPADWYLEIAA